MTSGGGFSNYYSIPSYQKTDVTKYFTSASSLDHNIVEGHGLGRGYPDISQSNLYFTSNIYEGNYTKNNLKLSEASLTVIDFISNINDARNLLGKGSLGWINPLLYKKSSSFMNDILSGNNHCVGWRMCCPHGFYATPGWDPTTGLGSIRYKKVETELTSLGSSLTGLHHQAEDKLVIDSTERTLGITIQRLSPPKGSTAPTKAPTSYQPTSNFGFIPDVLPSSQPTSNPSSPSSVPSYIPNSWPSSMPSNQPSSRPSSQPIGHPTGRPTSQPQSHPTSKPSGRPTDHPTSQPSEQPTSQPSAQPSDHPTTHPTSQPSEQPTSQPSAQPTSQPTSQPSAQPTSQPSAQPTSQPTSQPSAQPTSQPSAQPTSQPTSQPSAQPTSQPSAQPTCQPTSQPSALPTSQPSAQPTCQPTSQPSAHWAVL